LNLNVLLKSLNKALGNGNILWMAGAFAVGLVASKYILPSNLFEPVQPLHSQQPLPPQPPQVQQQEPVQEIVEEPYFNPPPPPSPQQQRINISNTDDMKLYVNEDIKMVNDYD
jgi:hypothetical protein